MILEVDHSAYVIIIILIACTNCRMPINHRTQSLPVKDYAACRPLKGAGFEGGSLMA